MNLLKTSKFETSHFEKTKFENTNLKKSTFQKKQRGIVAFFMATFLSLIFIATFCFLN